MKLSHCVVQMKSIENWIQRLIYLYIQFASYLCYHDTMQGEFFKNIQKQLQKHINTIKRYK